MDSVETMDGARKDAGELPVSRARGGEVGVIVPWSSLKLVIDAAEVRIDLTL